MRAAEVPDYPDGGEVFNALSLRREVATVTLNTDTGFMQALNISCVDFGGTGLIVYDYALLAN
jgi:hypothetical protein